MFPLLNYPIGFHIHGISCYEQINDCGLAWFYVASSFTSQQTHHVSDQIFEFSLCHNCTNNAEGQAVPNVSPPSPKSLGSKMVQAKATLYYNKKILLHSNLFST